MARRFSALGDPPRTFGKAVRDRAASGGLTQFDRRSRRRAAVTPLTRAEAHQIPPTHVPSTSVRNNVLTSTRRSGAKHSPLSTTGISGEDGLVINVSSPAWFAEGPL